jgi:hypothetical protein
MKASYNTLVEAINDSRNRGYSIDFNLMENQIECLSTKRAWEPEELTVVKFYRFEGASNPSDNSILYLIETPDGGKGLLVDSYGAEHGGISSGIIRRLKMNIKQ